MRMNARANPPVAPGFGPASGSNNVVRCLDISTYEKSKLEQLEEDATTTNVRIGAILSRPKAESVTSVNFSSGGTFKRAVVTAAASASADKREDKKGEAKVEKSPGELNKEDASKEQNPEEATEKLRVDDNQDMASKE